MAKSPEEKSRDAKAKRLWKFYRVTPAEDIYIEDFQRHHPYLHVLLEKGDPTEPALIFLDHNHTTGLIRGKLAYLINKALGVLEGSYKDRLPTILRALAEYLEAPPATIALGKETYGLIGKAKQKKVMIYGSAEGPILPPKKERKRKTIKCVIKDSLPTNDAPSTSVPSIK
jgi:hypothetical protein